MAFETLMEQGAVKRAGSGRPRLRPKRLAGDKAYSTRRIRRYLRQKGSGATIPRKASERRRGSFDKQRYKLRARIEQLIGRLKQFRRIATRYEKRADNYLGMVTKCSVHISLSRLATSLRPHRSCQSRQSHPVMPRSSPSHPAASAAARGRRCSWLR